ncbi:MAG: PVC-type heme-binding CxxCH protein [Pirellulales bacterium]
MLNSRLLRWCFAAVLGLIVLIGGDSPEVLSGQDQAPRPKQQQKNAKKKSQNSRDSKNRPTGKPAPTENPNLARYGIYAKTAPRPQATDPVVTKLPLRLKKGDRIALIGNTLFERMQDYGYFEALLHSRFPELELVVRNLSWSADTPDLQPRPANFADTEQHLTYEKIGVIFAAYGFNESFDGDAGIPRFRKALNDYMARLKSSALDGETGPRIVLVSPIPNENVAGVAAADRNNARIEKYVAVMREVAAEQNVGFADVYHGLADRMADPESDLTFNGAHLVEKGYAHFSDVLFQQVFDASPPSIPRDLRAAIVDKNRQYFRRFRPVNTFYYTGSRNRSYGYLDFLPAMRNFELLVANRDKRIWAIAQRKNVPPKVDDSKVPPLPKTKESRGANRWISAADELKEFKVDPRFEVNLFAGEEEFPDIAAPIQMRWDARGRLWVSCSTTYPHVYPGNEPNDKLVILEDTDGDGRADKSTVFADDLHIPLSFEFGAGGVYVSEEPELTFIKDTDGDGRADFRQKVLSGFGCEDSHHALHDFVWSPDGDLIFRDSIFLHSQIETPYGPVRQANSGWYRFRPRQHRLTSFGTYHSTNPWGVTFDAWGQHLASHPIYAAAFHSLDPPYPQQHPKPAGLRAYSGTCGQEFVDFATFPDEMQGDFIKVRYKPTNRVEILHWKETEFGYDEQYVSDLIFSSNLSFIPVDIRFGPRGAMYVCDWYNPVKGHAQYSLRDERRDRHSGRIWRIKAKGKSLQEPPKIAAAPIAALLDILKRREYRYRYWAKRELRERPVAEVHAALDEWSKSLDRGDPRFRHHQIEAIWMYRNIGAAHGELLREVLACDEHRARAAATQQLRYWHPQMPDAVGLLQKSANDPNSLVRMEAAIAASYIGTREALDAILDIAKYPREQHLAYAFNCALGSHTLRRHWEGVDSYARVPRLLKAASRANELREPKRSAADAEFDSQKNLKLVHVGCLPERMRYTVTQFVATTGQPVKLVFSNPDATDHNLVFVKPDALEEVGMAANEMAKNPRHANSDFIPRSKRHLILHYAPMIGPTRKSKVKVLRFKAPEKPGVYPYVCTFPGHWVIMTGEMIVVKDLKDVDLLLASRARPAFVKKWTMADFEGDGGAVEDRSVMRGMKAFMTARCNQCHAVNGHGASIGPDLTKVAEKYKGGKLLQQILLPSSDLNEKYRAYQLYTDDGKIVSGTILKEDETSIHIIPNLLTPNVVQVVPKKQVEEKVASKISAMPEGMVDMLTKQEIRDLLAFLRAGGFKVPQGLKHGEH